MPDGTGRLRLPASRDSTFRVRPGEGLAESPARRQIRPRPEARFPPASRSRSAGFLRIHIHSIYQSRVTRPLRVAAREGAVLPWRGTRKRSADCGFYRSRRGNGKGGSADPLPVSSPSFLLPPPAINGPPFAGIRGNGLPTRFMVYHRGYRCKGISWVVFPAGFEPAQRFRGKMKLPAQGDCDV